MKDKKILEQLGERLYDAFLQRSAIPPITAEHSQLTVEDAYVVQQCFVGQRLATGEQIVGRKIGVTSSAVMQQLKVDQPDFGALTDGMLVSNGGKVDAGELLQPKIEGELAFVLKSDLVGPGVTNADVIRATEGIMACLEIVDSRIDNWQIQIQDTVADNASCGMFVIGDNLISLRNLDVRLTGMVLEKNGNVVGTGAGAATLGSPVTAVAWLANTLGARGIPLRAGDVILSGALSAMVPITPGDHFRVAIQGVGDCSVHFDAGNHR